MARLNAKATTTSTGEAPYITGTAQGVKFGIDVAADGRRGQTILFASVSASSSGTNAIVAASPGSKIKVLSYSLVANAAVTVKWQSASTDLTGAMSFSANGGIATPIGSPASGWLLETAVGQALNLNLGSAVGVNGHISYFLEE
jgi:hypothetical protein